METLRNIDIPLVSLLLKASKSYETSKHRYKLCHINQMAQIAR